MSLNNKDPDLNITRQLTRAEQVHNQTIAQTCLIIILFLFGLYTIRAFVPSLIWGVIFAIACWPLYSKAKKHWPYQKPDFILPLLFSLVITFLFMFPFTIIVVEVTKDVQTAFEWAMHASRNGVSPPQWLHNLPFAQNTVINWWDKNLADPQSASHLFSNLHLSHGVYVTQQIGAQLFHRGLLFLFAIITLFFLFKDGESVVRQCLRGSRLLFGQQGENIAKQMISSVHGTVSGLVLVGLGQGIVLGLTYYFVGIPHAALFGIMTAIAAMVPFCPLIAIALVAITALLKVSSIAAISVIVIGCIVVFIADHFIRPALIGGSTKLPFIWVLIGILGGLESWGMIGLFVGPAIMAALMMLWYNWTANKQDTSSTEH